jgi:D123
VAYLKEDGVFMPEEDSHYSD